MAKRSSLNSLTVGKKAAEGSPAKAAPSDDMATTAVILSRIDIAPLSRVAAARKGHLPGRHSVSSVLRDLIDRHRGEIEGGA